MRLKSITLKKTPLIVVSFIWMINILLMPIFFGGLQKEYIYFSVLLLCTLFCYILVSSISTYGFFSLYSMFLMCLCFFNFGRLFLYLLGLFDFMNGQYSIIGNFVWEEDTAFKVINYYLIFVSVFSVFTSTGSIKSKDAKNNDGFINTYNCIERNGLLKVFRIVFLISVPFMMYFTFRQVFTISRVGYTEIYTGKESAVVGGGLYGVIRLIFSISFYMICALEHNYSKFSKIFAIYIIVIAITIIQGSRMSFIVAGLSFLYIRYRIYGKKIRASILLVTFISFILGIYFIECLRSGSLDKFSILGSFRYFFVIMSGSLNVPALYIQAKEELSTSWYPYILEPVLRLPILYLHPEIGGGQSMAMIQYRHNLSHHLTYYISSGYYLSGSNIGSNFIAEMAEFGVIGVIIGSVVFVKLLMYFDRYYPYNVYLRFMSIEFIRKILTVPRAEMFYDTYSLFKFGLIYFIIYLVASQVGKIHPQQDVLYKAHIKI